LPVDKLLIIGEFVMAVCLGLVAIFALLKLQILALICIFLMIIAYQLSIGSYFLVYIAQVTNETQNSVTVFFLWTFLLIISIVT
jgi:hypothetical protein